MQNLLGFLPFLACPVGMGLMMWMMMRGKKEVPMQEMQGQAGNLATNQPLPTLNPDERLATLRTELDDVEGQMNRLAAADRASAEKNIVAGSLATGRTAHGQAIG